jgi:hypothetical protein
LFSPHYHESDKGRFQQALFQGQRCHFYFEQ